MPMYEVEVSYTLPEWSIIQVEAENATEAEELAVKEFLMQEEPGYIKNLVVDSVKEISIG